MTHPAEWRSDGCSLQPVSSCSLQETHTKPHRTCECGVVRTDCISLTYLPRGLDAHKIHQYAIDHRNRTRGDLIWNVTFEWKTNLDILWCHTHLSDAGEPKFLVNNSSYTPETHIHRLSIIITYTNIIIFWSLHIPLLCILCTACFKNPFLQFSKFQLVLPPWLRTQLIHRVAKKRPTQSKIRESKRCTFRPHTVMA